MFPLVFWIAGLFVLLAPLATFVLLMLKGLPPFAMAHLGQVLLWVYQVSWIAALVAGVLLGTLVAEVTARTSYFDRPYDFGRCFSLGAIGGALSEALATWLYRALSHRPFSTFWIAGAVMAGCLSGGLIVSVVLSRKSATASRA